MLFGSFILNVIYIFLSSEIFYSPITSTVPFTEQENQNTNKKSKKKI